MSVDVLIPLHISNVLRPHANAKVASAPSKMASNTAAPRPDLYLIAEHDLVYEQDIIKTPYALQIWLDYANFKRRNGSIMEQAFVLERACSMLPRIVRLQALAALFGR